MPPQSQEIWLWTQSCNHTQELELASKELKIIEEYERDKIMCLNTEFKRNDRIHSERTRQYQKKKKRKKKQILKGSLKNCIETKIIATGTKKNL